MEGEKELIASDNGLINQEIRTQYVVNFLHFNSVPSLENMAIVYIATTIFKQSDIRDSMRQHSVDFDSEKGNVSKIRDFLYDDNFIRLEKNIAKKLTLLPLPNLLRVKVANVIRPVELQILECILEGRRDDEYLDSVFWTNEGTIDKGKTLEQLIDKDSGQYINSNFIFACKYCLEDSITNLWGKLPEDYQNEYLHSVVYLEYRTHLIAYWTSLSTNELHSLMGKIKPSDYKNIYNCNHSVYKNMFTLALSEGYSLAAKYFWTKLSTQEINSNLKRWLNGLIYNIKNYPTIYQSRNEYADILYFLLSKPNVAEEQRKIFQMNSHVILTSLFLNWPWQKFLLCTIRGMWNFLSEKVYVKLLSRIAREIEEGKTTEKLLRELWCDSPIRLKKGFIQYMIKHSCDGSHLICNLLALGNVETVRGILDYGNVEDRVAIFFSVTENRKLYNVFYDKFHLFKTLMEEIISLESDIKKIKETILLKIGNSLCHRWLCDNNWQMVEEFFNWTFTSEGQLEYFKHAILDKTRITYVLLRESNFALVNKFLGWCCRCEEEIKQFKKFFAYSEYERIFINYKDFSLFERILVWCFESEEDIYTFRLHVFQSFIMPKIIFRRLALDFDFEFVDKFLKWCCYSDSGLKWYKSSFVFSETWMEILQRFVSNYKLFDSEFNNWELIRKLIQLFSPLEEEIRIQLKVNITSSIDFNNFHVDHKMRSHRIEERHLFRLIDNDNYDIGDANLDQSN